MGALVRRGRVWYLDYHDSAGRRIRRRGSTDKTKAQQLLDTAEGRKSAVKLGLADSTVEIGDPEVSRLREAYLGHLSTHRRPRTASCAEQCLDNILEHLNANRASHLNVESVEKYQRFRVESVSARTVNMEVGALKAMLNWAVQARMLTNNPLAGVRPLKRDGKRFRRAMKPEEATAVLAAARKHCPRYELVLLTFLHTGLRREELHQLRWGDIDWRTGEIVVRAEVAKNHKSRRIPISNVLWPRLKALQENPPEVKPLSFLVAALRGRQKKRKLSQDDLQLTREAQELREQAEELVFTTELGTSMGNQSLNKLRLAVKHSKINPKGVDLHALRYTFGSWLVNAGVNIKLVSRLLGHSTIQITLDIYTDASIMDWGAAISKLPALDGHKTDTRALEAS